MTKNEQRHGETRRAVQNMKRILLQYRGRMDEQLRPFKVTTAQIQVLYAIHTVPGSSGADLARACYITPQTTQALLKHLETGGFIVRGKDPVNDRILTARITAAGEKLIKLVEKESAALHGEVWHDISDRELAQINRLLERCLANMGGVDEDMARGR